MTKVPQAFDFSFLNDEEARKILQVLERNEELQRAEKERISKLQKTKRDSRWLQGVTGEWFEEIQRKKFCNEANVSQMLKQPLRYRLSRGMAKTDSVELQISRSKNLPNQKNPTSFPPRLSFGSSFASLFSFRKSRKEPLKLPTLGQKGCGGLAGPPVSVRGTAGQAEIYSSPLENQPVDSTFVQNPAGMRKGSDMPPWDASLLENEFFRVLDDLDSTLAQEQSPSSVNTRTPVNYESRTQFSRFYSSGNRPGNTAGRHKNRYNETSSMSIYDILRPGAPRESSNTFFPRTRTIYDMYTTRKPRVFQEGYVQKNTFGSSSLCFHSIQRSASPATRHFTARSLHFPATAQNNTGFIPQSHQQSPKRTRLSSIIWNRSDSSRDGQNQEEFLRAPSPMETDPADQYMYPRCFQNSIYEFYHSQSVYQSVGLNAPIDNRMSPDPFENSENMPFYHQDNPFSRSFFSNTFGRGREQRFGRSPFWGQQEDHSSWSDFYQNRKPFTSSDRDFEMLSTVANSASDARGRSVPFQHQGSFSPGNGPDVSRDQEEPCPWQVDFQTSTLESMELSQDNGNQLTPNFSTPNACPMTDSSYHTKSGGLECQQDSSREVHLNKESYSFGISQPLASSFKTSFPQISDDKGNPQSSSFQNPTVTLQEIIPNKPVCFPIRSHTEVIVSNSDSTDSPPLAESQPSISVTEGNNEKDLNNSILEKYEQLNKMDQANMTGEQPQLVLQTGISNSLPDFQNPLSQDSAENNQFVFNTSTTVSSKRSPRVLPRKDISKIYVSHRDKANELKKEKSFSGNRKLGSETSSPFLQDCRTSPSFPSPNQGCHQELTVNNEDISSIIKNNHWNAESTDNQNPQSPEKPVILDSEGEQCTITYSINSRSVASHSVSCDPLGQPSDALQDSSALNNSFLDALVIPSATVFSRRSPSGNDPSLGEREEKDNTSKNQNNQFAISPLESQKNNDNCVPVYNKMVDVVKCHSAHPFRDGKGERKIKCRVYYVEKSSKPENRSTSANDSSNLSEVNQGNSKAPGPYTIYCTLPRKSPSFLINRRKSESKVMAASFSNGPLPFQIKNNAEDPIGKYTSNKFSPSSPESDSECSKAVSDSAPVIPAAAKWMTNMKITGSASVRKEPLPFLIRRALSCPSGEPYSSIGSDEREKHSVLDTDASAVSPRPWERIINTLESDSSVKDCSLTKSHHQKEYSQECAENDGKIAASRTGIFSLPNEDPLPFSSEVSGKESGKTLHKYKTTSMFSVSGDDDNIKYLEVVSIYYTLPRKHSKKFCNLLEKYTQNTNSITESPKVGTEAFSNASQNDKLNYSTQEQSGTPSSEDRKMLVKSAQENSPYISHTTENVTVLQLPDSGSSEPTLQEMTSVEAGVSLPKGESETREIFPDNFTKAPLSDSRSRKKKGKKLQRETLRTSLMLQEKEFTEEKLENCQQSIKSSNGRPSSLPAPSEDNVEKSETVRSSGENVGSGIAITSTGSGKCPQQGISTAIAEDDSSSGLQTSEVRGKVGTHCPQMTDKALSDSENHTFAVTLALHKLQFDEETYSGRRDIESLQSEPKELPQRSQEVNMTECRKAKDEKQRLAWDQPSLPGGSNENVASLDDLEKGKNRSSVKHKLAAMSKASRKFPVTNLSPRKHVATIFTESESRSGIGGLAPSTPETTPLTPEPTPTSAESTDESRRLSNDGVDVEKFETPLQVTVIANREPSTHLSDQKSNINISQTRWNEFKNISESLPKNEDSIDVTVAQTLERESVSLDQPTFISLREAAFSDHQKRLSPPCPLEPACKSPTVSIPLANCQQQQRSTSSPEWELEPHLYRSKSLKNISVHGDKLHKNHPPKVRERHFSENTSIDNALSRLTLGNEFSINNGFSRRFRSFSEFPSCDESENWALYSDRTKTGRKPATSISRPIDYGIFGKEQQLAFLENVKRSLTQGRLWKPSFLKNPGFLKDDIINPPNPSESLSSNSPSSQMPDGGLSPAELLNIYEEDPVDSACDTDTTTDDEYYLDENDKESEL
ncbi:exophilin-5 isoform X3 [Trichechus manatus latirostris]|uniref:Exophilin-5 isoform X3 n=3 Tax=Trichechus manatus latirostris TaxID=127582 RepID=A0A2Y9DWL8_TRIMA|nr:exophilin-5 isoform X3 [Trichechus manatus latirostris]